MEFPYTSVPSKLRTFLDRIPDTGIPARLTQRELEARGFRSSNDRTIMGVLRCIGLVDGDSVPTDAWSRYRDKGSNKAILAGLIRSAYSELFEVYPSAQSQPEQDIRNFMASRTRTGERAVRYMVATFRTLCTIADWDPADSGLPQSRVVSTSPVSDNEQRSSVAQSYAPSANIAFHFHIDAGTNPDTIEALIRSIASYITRDPYGSEGG